MTFSVSTTYQIPLSFYGNVREGMLCREQEVILEGPADCLGGETRIHVVGQGPTPVQALYQQHRPVPVMTTQGPATAEPPFIKGTAPIYRISTADGRSFTATERHRVLTSSGWAFVGSLRIGQSLPVCDVSRPLTSQELGPLGYQQDVLHWTYTASGSRGHCSDCLRQGDERPHWARDTAQWHLPSRGGVLSYTHVDRNEDDLGSGRGRSHPHLCAALPSSSGYSLQTGRTECRGSHEVQETPLHGGDWFPLGAQSRSMMRLSRPGTGADPGYANRHYSLCESGECPYALGISGLSASSIPDGRRLHGCFSSHCTRRRSLPPGRVLSDDILLSCPPPSPYYTAQWTTVSNIEYVREDVYYDLHVPGPENYLAEGVFHHNTGKTLGLLYKIHRCAVKYPGSQFSILRKVRAHLYGTVLVTWKRDIVAKLPPGYLQIYGGEAPLHYTYPNGPDKADPYEGGSRIWFGGLDNPGQTLSGERDIIYVVQAEEITVSDWEHLIRMATGRGAKMPYSQVIGDCNPASHTHWILQRWDKGQGGLRLFKTVHRDNPSLYNQDTGNLTPDGERRLSALRRLTGHLLKRLYFGIWAPPEGAIFSMYEEETHKVESFTPPRPWPRFVGVDPYGAKIAAVWVAFDPQGRALHVYREYVQPFGVTTGEHVKQILEMAGYSRTGQPTHNAERIYAWVGGGPSERQQRTDFTGFGLPLIPSPIRDVWAGIDRIAGLMREGRLFIHDTCVELLSEIGDYRRKINQRTGVYTDQIENKDIYHCIDALRYVLSYLTGSGEETEDEIVDYSVAIGPRL